MANSVNRYFEGLLIGGTLGFVAGLLTAPKPGSELRKELAEGASDLLDQAGDQWLEMKDRVSDKVQPLAEKASVYKDRAADQANLMRGKIMDQATQLKEQASLIKDKVADQAQNWKDQAGTMKDSLAQKAGELGDKATELKDKASDIKEKAADKIEDFSTQGKDLLNNYMGNNSGPMYTPGAKANPNSSATSMGDACSNYEGGNPGAAGS